MRARSKIGKAADSRSAVRKDTVGSSPTEPTSLELSLLLLPSGTFLVQDNAPVAELEQRRVSTP